MKSKKARAKMLKKDLAVLEKKEAEMKEKERIEAGNRAIDMCQHRYYELSSMAAEDHHLITIDEFVDFVLVTAGRSPEGHSYDGFGCSTPPRRQAVFVWGFGDQRLDRDKRWNGTPSGETGFRHRPASLSRPRLIVLTLQSKPLH